VTTYPLCSLNDHSFDCIAVVVKKNYRSGRYARIAVYALNFDSRLSPAGPHAAHPAPISASTAAATAAGTRRRVGDRVKA